MNNFMDVNDMFDTLASFTNKIEKTTAQLEVQKSKLSTMVSTFKRYKEETRVEHV